MVLFGIEIERRIRYALQHQGCLVIADRALDRRLKTDMQIAQIDGQDVLPLVCIQLTLKKENGAKIQNFLNAAAGKYCRFIYIEISGHRNTGKELFNAGTIAKAIKKIISKLLRDEWKEDKGAKNKIFHVHIINHSKNEYTDKIRRLA